MQFDLFENPSAVPGIDVEPLPRPAPIEYHRTVPGYARTPLYELPRLAERLGVARVLVKDESSRLGLPAFKMLGASWAVAYAVRTNWLPDAEGVLSPAELGERLQDRAAKRLIAATDGNHGRGVARMAKLMGVGCLIFVPEGLAESRIRAIESEGAEVRIVAGSYDDAIRRSAEEADAQSLVVSDTSWEGYRDIPKQVTNGYSTMFAEVDDALSEAIQGATSTRPTRPTTARSARDRRRLTSVRDIASATRKATTSGIIEDLRVASDEAIRPTAMRRPGRERPSCSPINN